MYFLALSHAPPVLDMDTAIWTPDTREPARTPARARVPKRLRCGWRFGGVGWGEGGGTGLGYYVEEKMVSRSLQNRPRLPEQSHSKDTHVPVMMGVSMTRAPGAIISLSDESVEISTQRE